MIAPLQELGLEQRIIIIIICASIADAVDMSADRTFTANYHQLLHQRPKPFKVGWGSFDRPRLAAKNTSPSAAATPCS